MKNQENFCTIYVVRHGEALANAQGIVAGITDTELTENGKEQARERAKAFANIKFDSVFSSDLARARQTAEITRINHELAVNTRAIIRERHFGEFEGKSIDEYINMNKEMLEKLKGFSEAEKMRFQPYETYETNESIASRMTTFLREVAATYGGKTLLVVSHGSIMRATLVSLGVCTFDELPSFAIEHLGYFKLRTDGVEFFVEETQGINKQIS